MLTNKKFQNNETGEIITIIGSNGVFYNLSNGSNIKVDIFFQKYSEVIDPNSFFNNNLTPGLENIVEKIKNVDTSKIKDIGGMPPDIKYNSEPSVDQINLNKEYKEKLLREFKEEQARNNLSQYKVYDNDDDAALDFENKINQKNSNNFNNEQIKDEFNIKEVNEQPMKPSYLSAEEEAFRFFKSFKKVYPINLTIEFDERIAEPNFIKMMAVNYEGDIIKFYTKEFMNRIYNDPGFLENKIYEKLKNIVFENDKPKRPRAKKVNVNIKNEKPKKPRVKKVNENIKNENQEIDG